MKQSILFAAFGAVLCLLTPLSARAEGRDTLVFISDLHLNVDASYAWLRTNAPSLAAFINRVNARRDVSELVILGDMLDDWVETVENAPHTFEDVLASPNNAEIVSALQNICRNPNIRVTYVTGNHDMLSFETANKACITNIIPGLNIISEAPGLGAYTRNNVIWTEHGHRYCMFNAPDTWSRAGGRLPLGYFISRIAASKSARDKKVYTTMEALDSMIKAPGDYYTPPPGEENVVFNNAFIAALFDFFALVWGGYKPWDVFKMRGTDHFVNDPSVAGIGKTYGAIYSEWPNRMNTVHQYEAVFNDVGSLLSAANMLFEMPDRIKSKYPFTPRIVLFGHTHKPVFYYYCDSLNAIYANTGTWIDGQAGSWVEIKITDAGETSFYTVSLWFDGESAPRQRAALEPLAAGMAQAPNDCDGDGKSDMVLFNPSAGAWYIASLDGEILAWDLKWGWAGVCPLSGDYDGDGRADLAVFDRATGAWYIVSLDGAVLAWGLKWGWPGVCPLSGDYDGDGKADLAVFDRTAGAWYIVSLDGTVLAWDLKWGWQGAWPVGAF